VYRFKNSIIFLCLNLSSYGFFAQVTEKIKVRRSENDIYLFQKGEKSDTVSNGRHDLFFMIVPKHLRCETRIEIENGQLLKAGNDTTYRLKHLSNLNYLHQFNDSTVLVEVAPNGFKQSAKKVIEKCSLYTVLINGSNTSADASVITIRVINITNDKVILSNRFYYK
jgi:hypothetical protein